MTSGGPDSERFEALSRELLNQGFGVRFEARGASMSPCIRDGEMVHVTAVIVSKLRKDDIVLTKGHSGFRVHRLVVADHDKNLFITRGDCGLEDDPPIRGEQILGVVIAKEVRIGKKIVRTKIVRTKLTGFGSVLQGVARVQAALERRLRRDRAAQHDTNNRHDRVRRILGAVTLLFALFAAVPSRAQVVVDATTSRARERTGAGTVTNNFTHTTANVANRLLVVGVAMNITNAPTTAVTSITYGGTALIFLGAHNDAGNTRRVEMWYLLNPAVGNNVAVDENINIPVAGATVGIASGATTFDGVDQTVPLGSFVSADGAAGGNSQLDVPSVINGMILDTLATGGNQTVTVPGPQVSQWNLATGGADPPDVTSTGSSRTGAPSVPISEAFNGTSNWSLGAISINPTSADIGVTTSVSAVALGQSSTYNITVVNNGPSSANVVKLVDTMPVANLTLGTVTPSAGTTCTSTTNATTITINCTLPTPLTSGATATIAVSVTASAAGFYPNTATVSDTAPPPDPNTGNNTYVALAPVVSVVCAANTLTAAPAPLSGVQNTYYPGTASVAAGAKSIPVGAATGAAGAIANGSLLLVIQMQDASINTGNTVVYGNGSTGSGFTTINNAGNYEFVTATGAVGSVTAGAVPISGAGTGGGLVFGYNEVAATGTKGQSTYQVVLVPQYLSATLSSAAPPTAAAWNGSTGGVLALDIAGALNLGGATVSVDGLGFRGGAGMQLTGGVAGASNADYRQTAPTTYTGAVGGVAGIDASKGEGVAGTPRWVEFNNTFLQTTTTIGYPNGAADGSMARGAPGNAGAGGTDGDATGNTENAGGGGGGNGGQGGFGGDSWNTNLSDGGEGGAVFPATIDRISMGGGGGAGTRNNSDGDNQASGGAAGGGIIFIRADSLTGAATLTANGASAYNGTLNDAGGGGGAGGSIIVLAANGGESGLTLQANGGRGGDAWDAQTYSLGNRHGPGGGGAGGVILVSGAPAGISVTGGASGTTLTPGVTYGSTVGNPGVSATNATLSQVTGIQSASLCAPDMTLGKSHVGNFTRGLAASYTVPVSNVGIYGATSGVVTINDTLPFGLTPTSATGTGWTCSVSGQTISCTRSDSLPKSSSYPSLTLSATVLQTAPATVTNTATVAGGGEANLLNDTATDVASVISSADMKVTETGSPNPVAAGSNITYTQVVTNSGPSAADNATVVSPIPLNTTFVSIAAPAGWSCATPGVGNTGNVVCTDVSMAGSTAGTFTLVVKVGGATANGTVITDTVSVSSSVSDPNSANNTASVNTVVGGTGPNLTVTNAASPNPVQAGSPITYTQVVVNTGSSAATTATFNETTPPNTTFVSITPPAGWTCTTFPPQCTDPSVAANTSGTFTVVYKVNAGTGNGTVITDTATANSANQSYGASSAIATDIVGSATQADVVLTSAGTPSSVFAGNNITYTQAISNNGPATATGLSFTETTPTNTTFASVSAPAGWTCTAPAVGATGAVTCTAASLAVADEADIIVVVNVPSTVTAAQSPIAETASVTTTSSDPNAGNNTNIPVSTPVTVVCDLAVTNSGTPSPVAAGSNITYTQVITNPGPSNCSTGTLSEATPTNTTFVSAAVVNTGGGTWTCPNAAPIACTSSSVAPGATATLTAVYTVNAGTAAGTIITDTATVATTSRDTNRANNTATSQIAVASGTQADLSVTNSGSPNPVNAGSNITFTQSVTNAGPATATTVSFTDPVPANTTLVSLTGPGTWTCTTTPAPPTCTIASLASGTTANFTFVVTVSPTVASGSTITQTDSVTSAVGDPNSGNNSAAATVYVSGSADVSITDTASPIPVLAGNDITYTQVVSNAGPSAATGTTVSESLPANTTSVSLSGPAPWLCTLITLTCTNPSLAPASPATITYVVKVTAGTPAGTKINDIVSVSSSVSDPNTSNNAATAADIVATATQADLVTTNSALPTSVAAGGNVTYTQTVTNDGPAAATGVSFTEVTPPNTNFQSITPPAGWTCPTLPAVGGTGAITCNDGSSLAVGAANTATFSLVLQVNSGTPSGTNITETDASTATNIVTGLTSSANATVVVANANSAAMTISKTGTPNPVTEGTPLTYTLTVNNTGPSTATNVTVTDSLPSALTYLSSTVTPSAQGSCSEANGLVTCLLGTMAYPGTPVTISILTIPNAPGLVTNTATVTADQDPAGSSSSWPETVTYPTSVMLQSFSAHSGTDKNGASRVILNWKTGGEAHNLGFNVYREQNGNRVRMNPSIIAGSALLMRGALPRHSGRSYTWIDPSAGVAGASYLLEDIDVDGTRTLHGPISVEPGLTGSDASTASAATRMFGQLSQAQPSDPGSQESHVVETVPSLSAPTASQVQKQFDLASHAGVKIFVRHEGWYRVGQADLVKAGLDQNADPSRLHLYAEAVEQPMQITGATAGPGGFGPQAAINFYGTGIDTVFSGTRVYWLVAEDGNGARIPRLQASSGSNQPPPNFSATVELRQHTTYFSALLTNDDENFFGALISPTPVEQVLNISHLNPASSQAPIMTIVLQGVIVGFPHDVSVAVNGTSIGDLTFTGQAKGRLTMNLPPGLLLDGNNTITLTAQNGDYDLSLVQAIRITYPRKYAADSDELKFYGRPGDEIDVTGFASTPTVLDVTDPNHPVQLTPQAISNNGKVAIALQIPWTTTNPAGPPRHTLLAVAADSVAAPASILPNHPSHWHSAQAGADIAMVTNWQVEGPLAALVRAHQAEGKSSVIVRIGDLYDEFNFGERSPFVIRQFLQSAQANWNKAPSYLLLNGRASLDPRNYLGLGSLDLVPTRIVPAAGLMTASDDWFSDFNDSGMPTIATGRLPVATLDDARTVVAKIVAYDGKSTNGPWTSQALMVADKDGTENFSQDARTVQSQLPASIKATEVFVNTVGSGPARQDIVDAINSGQLLVNYLGHGSEEQWSGSDIFDTNTVGALTNGSQLPVFLTMDCLNGFFQDVYSQPLSVTLLLAPNGGAVAVLASSGLNQAPPQTKLDELVVQSAFGADRPTLGDSILKAKAQIKDEDVRRTFVLLGDPAMQVKQPSANSASH